EMGLAAARRAVDRWRGIYPPEAMGVFVGAEPERARLTDLYAVGASGGGGGHRGYNRRGHGVRSGCVYHHRSPSRLTDALADLIAAAGPGRTYWMAGAASAAAIAAGFRAVAQGEIALALVGGAALNVEPMLYAGFSLLRAMSQSGRCRPFDASRDGFVL